MAVMLADRRFLADGEVSGHGEGTTTFSITRRFGWWHKLDQLQRVSSLTPAMAATTARLHYAGETRLVAVKKNAWEESGAHPKHTRAEIRTGGATEKRVVDHSKHGGGVPASVVEERSN